MSKKKPPEKTLEFLKESHRKVLRKHRYQDKPKGIPEVFSVDVRGRILTSITGRIVIEFLMKSQEKKWIILGEFLGEFPIDISGRIL